MSLGEQLRKAIERLRNTSSFDKQTVKESVKDIQRALIASDVEIGIVLELSKKIEDEAFTDLAQGLNRREHVIKLTYEALANALGGSPQPPANPKRILLAGLFGSGKCVHPDTLIPTVDGNNKTIKELYENAKGNEHVLEDGIVKELQNTLEVFSVDPISLKIVKGKATHIWKLKKDKPLHKIYLDNGNNHSVIVTPEHPFFVLENAEIKKTRADELKLGQFVATPRKLLLEENDELKNLVKNRIPDEFLIVDEKLAGEAKKTIIGKYGTLINAFHTLNEKYSYCTFTANLKKKTIAASLLKKIGQHGFDFEFNEQIRLKKTFSKARKIRFPTKVTLELAEFMGYVYADGHMAKQYVEIVNEDDNLIERIKHLGETLFNVKPTIKKDSRTKNLRKVIFASVILTKMLNLVFELPYNKKSDIIRIHKLFLTAKNETKNAFLQAYFDCDGYIAKGTRQIEFCSASKGFAEDLRVMLAGHGMTPNYSKKFVKNKPYYRMSLKAKDVETFAKEIGSRVEFKQKRLLESFEFGKGQTLGKQETLILGGALKEVREFFGATIGEIQQYVNSYGVYEKEGIISRNSLKKFLNCVSQTKNKNNFLLKTVLQAKNFDEMRKETNEPNGWTNATIYRLKELGLVEYSNWQIKTTQKGLQLLEKNEIFNQEKITQLEKLANSELNWIKIKKIELVDNTEHVYDLTVEDCHNFVANQIIVHNTTSTIKLAKWYTKRGLKVGVICADTFRVAAFEQLKQLSEKAKIDFFGVQNEKNAAKVVKEGIAHFKGFDLIICDSAGRSGLDEELVKEIKEINRVFEPDQKWIVLSADIGQVAKKQAKAFDEAVKINGVVITKTDGSGKGGGALAACRATNSSVYFIGTGEKIDDFEQFDANRFLSRIMGYGDLGGLLEKARQAQEESEEDLEEIMEKGFTLETFYAQLKAAKKMGPLNKVLEMAGFSQSLPKEAMELGEEKLDGFKVILDSMTKQEKRDPKTLNKSRIERIAKGSGKKEEEVRELLKNYKNMEKMFKQFSGLNEEKIKKGGLSGFLKKFSGKKKKLKIR